MRALEPFMGFPRRRASGNVPPWRSVPPVDAADVVPWLALALAAASFGWQVIEARRRRATRVGLEVQHAAVPASVPDGPELVDLPGLGIEERTVVWPTDEPLAYVVVLMAVNRGESQESLLDLRFSNREQTIGAGANPGGPPLGLPPHDRRAWAFRVDHVAFDLADGFYADVILGARAIRSGPHFLDSGLVEHIAAHNAEVQQGGR